MRDVFMTNRKQAFSFIGLAFSAAIVAGCAAEQPSVNSQPAFYRNLDNAHTALDVQDAARTISDYRKSQGLAGVVIDPELVALAQSHAIAQAKANKVGHNVGGSFKKRLGKLTTQRPIAVENVGAGYRSLAQAFSGWRNSKGHNANMLKEGVTRIGIAKGFNPSSKYKVFWTLILTNEPIS